MGRIEKQKRLIIEQANKRLLGESMVDIEKVVKDMKYKFGHSDLSSDIIDEFEKHMGSDLIDQLTTNEYTDLFSDWMDSKREDDSNNNEIYYETSDGTIRDKRTNNTINENKDIDSEQRYVNGIVNIIKPPYYNFLKVNEVPEELWNDIFSKLFKQKVKYSYMFDRIFLIHDSNNKEIYHEEFDGFVADEDIDLGLDEFGNPILGLDEFGNPIIDVYWEKHEYDSNNNLIYYEKSGGYWEKREFDSNNNQIYYENSDGEIRDNR